MTSPIPDRAVLEGLLGRVRAAKRPDWELDGQLWEALVGPVTWMPLSGPVTEAFSDVPGLTNSLDAITALVASRGFGWQIDQTEGAFVSDEDDQWHETCATPVLSLVGALLVAEMERAGDG